MWLFAQGLVITMYSIGDFLSSCKQIANHNNGHLKLKVGVEMQKLQDVKVRTSIFFSDCVDCHSILLIFEPRWSLLLSSQFNLIPTMACWYSFLPPKYLVGGFFHEQECLLQL